MWGGGEDASPGTARALCEDSQSQTKISLTSSGFSQSGAGVRLKRTVFGWGAVGQHPRVLRALLFSAQYSHIIPSADSLDSSSFIRPWGLEEQPLGRLPVLNGLGMQGQPEKAWGFFCPCAQIHVGLRISRFGKTNK